MAFGHKLAIRPAGTHAQCGICVRHKLLLKKLTNDRAAKQRQLEEYESHLDRQYRDRSLYWSSRGLSRLSILPDGNRSVTIVTDAIDHSKFRYPRSHAVAVSKELSGFIRPSMDLSAVLAHGQSIALYMSEPWVRKDSSWCSEILCHTLTMLPFDLRETEIVLQADNCSRECKNNSLTRLAGLLTGMRRCRRFEMRFLATGHSHEDVDQLFSTMAAAIERCPEVHVPSQFQDLLESWLANSGVRPHEQSFRKVFKVDQVRNW